MNFLLSHFLLFRDESRRRAQFFDLQLLKLKNKSIKSISCLLYVMSNDKINQNDRIEYAKLLRHRNIEFCTMNVMIIYFVWRWKQFDEIFSSFKTNMNWYDVQLLTSKSSLDILNFRFVSLLCFISFFCFISRRSRFMMSRFSLLLHFSDC